MKYFTFFLLALVSVIGCSKQHKSGQHQYNWDNLFNGKSLDGWIVKCNPADDTLSFWSVQDGTIEANSLGHPKHDYVWLQSENEYKDFTLRLQFQMYKNANGNSGIQIRSRYDDNAAWLDGPQVDIHPAGPWRTGMVWDETRGNKRWLYPLIPADTWVDTSMAVPGMFWFYNDQGTGWNDLEITTKGCRLYASLNGVQVMNYDGTGVLDDSTHQAHRVGMQGHILLQIHRNDETRVRFRDIKIREY